MRLIDADVLKNRLTALVRGGTNLNYCISNMIDRAPTVEPEPNWIPCSERLPEKHGESYIVTISDGAVYSTALQWDANGKRWYLSFLNDGNILVDFIEDVIAWMPLPEKYREEGEQDG